MNAANTVGAKKIARCVNFDAILMKAVAKLLKLILDFYQNKLGRK
jgi:hypothetical protein